MAKTTPPVAIEAEFSQDPSSGEWVATSMQTPRISVRSIDIRSARDGLASQLAEKLGKPVQIVDKLKLPRGLAEEVAAYQKDHAKMEALRSSLDERFIPLAKSLLRARLQQQQIAALLCVSKQWVSQALKQDATGTYRGRER